MKRVNFHLTDKEIKSLETLSRNKGISKAEIIRRAIDNYIRKENKK